MTVQAPQVPRSQTFLAPVIVEMIAQCVEQRDAGLDRKVDGFAVDVEGDGDGPGAEPWPAGGAAAASLSSRPAPSAPLPMPMPPRNPRRETRSWAWNFGVFRGTHQTPSFRLAELDLWNRANYIKWQGWGEGTERVVAHIGEGWGGSDSGRLSRKVLTFPHNWVYSVYTDARRLHHLANRQAPDLPPDHGADHAADRCRRLGRRPGRFRPFVSLPWIFRSA